VVEGMSRDERSIILELLETTIPFNLKVIALMGEKKYKDFLRIRNDWKRRLAKYFTDVQNFDGSYSAVFLDNLLPLIEEYHEEANARYGEIIKNQPEMITRSSAGTQSLVISKITEENMNIVPVEYLELSESTVFDARTKAVEIAVTKNTWKPSGDEARGPVFISQVYFMLESIEYARVYYKKALQYHSERQSNSEKYSDYWVMFTNYMLSRDQIPQEFKPSSKFTLEEKILSYLDDRSPHSAHYKEIAENLGEKPKDVALSLGRLLVRGQIAKIDKGIYSFKALTMQSIGTKEDFDVSNS